MTTRLTNKAKASSLLQIAIGLDEEQFNNYIDAAQKFDFKPLVCEEFYFDLLEKKEDPAWKKLIEGGTYTYNERVIEFSGFDAVISFFAYARMIIEAPMVSTSHGVVSKLNPHSQPVPLEDRRNIYYKKKEEANTLMKDVVLFIERNLDTYSSWKCSNSCSTTGRSSGFKTILIQ
jgi:hypothetical protein